MRIQDLRFEQAGFSAGSMKISTPCERSSGSIAFFITYFGLSGMDFYSGPDYSEMTDDQRSDLFKHKSVFAYRRLTQELVRQGFTVVQYDPLAAGCQLAEVGSRENPFCVRTEETSRARLSDFYVRLSIVIATALRNIDPEKYTSLILVSHSGASLVVSDFLRDAGRRYPDLDIGFVGLSPAVGSGLAAFRFQKVDLWVRQFERCARSQFVNCAALVLSDKGFLAHVQQAERDRIAELVRDQGAGSVEGIREVLEKAHSRMLEWLIASTREPNPTAKQSAVGGLIRPNADLFRELLLGHEDRGANLTAAAACRLIYGELDTALSPEQEREVWVRRGGRVEDVLLLPALGHWLGDDPLAGPPSEIGISAVLKAVVDVSESLDRSLDGLRSKPSSCVRQQNRAVRPNKLH